MKTLKMTVGPYDFTVRMETANAPETCRAFEKVLPFTGRMIHVRWSGEAGFLPLGDYDLGVDLEDPTSYPAPREILFFPGGISECEILVPYGGTCFASKAGQLAGTHFLTVVEGEHQLRELGEALLYDGAHDTEFSTPDSDR